MKYLWILLPLVTLFLSVAVAQDYLERFATLEEDPWWVLPTWISLSVVLLIITCGSFAFALIKMFNI